MSILNDTPSLLAFGPLGPMEMGIVLFVIVLLFGAKKLPMLARSVGKSMGEFKKGRKEFEDELTKAADETETEKNEA